VSVDQQIVENQRRFRLANERIDQARAELGFDGERIPFLCECPDAGCTSVVPLTAEEYGAVRSGDDQYVLLEAHLPEDEEALERHDGYVVARKEHG
jgi:hypothetical protein